MKIARAYDAMAALLLGFAVGAGLSAVAMPGSVLALPAGSQLAADDAAPRSELSAEDAYRLGEEFYGKQNYAEAMRWYRIAADQGNTQAQVHIGNLYAEGQGVAQDYGEALRWYRPAAERGDQEAQNNLGWFYLSGWGVPQDYGEALRWLRKAADQGNEVSQRNIGMMYLQGLGVAQDKNEAIRWFRKAAALGDDDAKQALRFLGAE